MAELISTLRKLTNASASDFTDDQVQEFLDARRVEVRRARLVTTPDSNGEYHDYYSAFGNWEQDAVIEDGAGNAVTPTTSEWLVGHWGFTSNTPPPLFITGKAYDVYGAAADLLEAWAARVVLEFDFEADGASYKRHQKQKALLTLATQYRRLSWPQVVAQHRPDLMT